MKTLASITLPAQMNSLAPALAFVRSFAVKSGFDDKKIGEIELCLEEILVNVFSYAYPEGAGEVEISYGMDTSGPLIVEVADHGIPFDLLSVADPNTAAGINERHIGGLGIYFVKQLMDQVRYRREDNQNILTLSINKPSAAP
jgi:serine/threonine-protein kinase RsbW